MSFWPFKRKPKVQELDAWQQFLQHWQKNVGEERLVERAAKPPLNKMQQAYWLIHQERVLAVVASSSMMPLELEVLASSLALTIEQSDVVDGGQIEQLNAPLHQPQQLFINYKQCALSCNDENTLFLWINTAVYDQKHTFDSEKMSDLFSYALIYHLLPVRFKEQDKSFSVHVKRLRRAKGLPVSQEHAQLQIVGQHNHDKNIRFNYWLVWPQKGDSQGRWLAVIKRLCYHLTMIWQQNEVALIYKPTPPIKMDDCLLVEVELRYLEPYRLPLMIALPVSTLVLLSRHYTQQKHNFFWSTYHHFNIYLWSKYHKNLTHTALYGRSQEQQGHHMSLADLLLFLPEVDAQKVLQNFVGVHYRSQMRALFAYTSSLDAHDIRWVVSDLFESNLLAKLPKAVASDWAFQAPAQNIGHWQELNDQVLNDLARSVQEGRLELSVLAREWLIDEVINQQQQRLKNGFEQKYSYLIQEYWLKLSRQQQLQLAGKLHNRQWAELLVLKPEFERFLKPLMSSRRFAILGQEVEHVLQLGVHPYAQALALMEQILHIKY